jgi:hypothetical protein
MALLWAAGCASQPKLRPAPQANLVEGTNKAVVETAEGVRLEARVDAWRWTPSDLDRQLTPLLVRIDNDSGQPLRVRFEEFKLVTPGGMSYAALPPFNIKGEVTEQVGSYAYSAPGFYVAPHLRGYYSGFGVYGGYPFGHYPYYYTSYHPVYARYELPTRDMLIRALPEGVLEPGGSITGFIYFADLETINPTPNRVQLRYVLVNAETRERFGVIDVPFQVVDD